ncbi:nodulation protein NfeD [Paenibacillus sp. J5C_2022]|uniref:NfeD family protein n=1 Tax=Paenibacillus sp. J5C2022 TaxID=2977129 RepID=UPI0021D117AB|nr:NfeD family protein [Paenibacillus sp. J5C2022]MCU6707671.1 nodulation protein NfeD [Paenibacillus sp. J5C2022]
MHWIKWKRAISVMLVLWLAAGALWTAGSLLGAVPALAKTGQGSEEAGSAVFVIPVKHTVEQGLYAFLKRAFKEAEEGRAAHVILVVNTLGGEVVSASDIGELIRSSSIPTTAYVEGKAVSAGTYIALNADHIAMQPGSTIGSAAVVNGSTGEMIQNPKVVSFWVSQMTEAAKLNGRDPAIAAAMVDVQATVALKDKIGRDKQAGEILSLSHSEANKVGYSDYTASSVQEVAEWLGLGQRTLIEVQPSIAEEVARFLIHPAVSTVLLIIGIAGIAIELLVPGFGVPGIMGMLAMGLFFFGSYLSGFAGMESVVLFVLGVVLLFIEIFVPSFGILGLLGSASLVAGVVIAAPDPRSGILSLAIAFVAALVIVVLFARTHRGRGVWNKFILRDKLTTEEGYLSAASKELLVGQEGIAVTPLRPAGTALLADQRVDVITSGQFIEANTPVQVVKVEGTWVVVKAVEARTD